LILAEDLAVILREGSRRRLSFSEDDSTKYQK